MTLADLNLESVRNMELDMAKGRRLTINPPLTVAEFSGFCAANPGLQIDRDPSGVIIVKRKRERRDDDSDSLESQRGTIRAEIDLGDDERQSVSAEVHAIAQDTETLQALEALEGRLIRERETSKGAHATALNVAIRAVVSHIDILESLIAHERGVPPKVTGRDMDTYDQRREFLTEAGQPLEENVHMAKRVERLRIDSETHRVAMEIGGMDDAVVRARFESIIQMTIDLFEGDQRAATNWLTTPKTELHSQTPLESIRTESGAEEVKDLIGRLEHGSFS